MDPITVIIPADGTGTTAEEIQADIDATVAQLRALYPFLSELAEAYKALEEGEDKDLAKMDLDALDEKRRLLDDHLANENRRMRALIGE